jgi:hypothetical protein
MSVLCQCACVCVCAWGCWCLGTVGVTVGQLAHAYPRLCPRDQARGLAGTFMHIATCHGRNHTRWTEPRVVSYNIDGGGGWSQLGHRRQEALTNDMKKLCEQEAHVAKGGIVRACTTVQLCH